MKVFISVEEARSIIADHLPRCSTQALDYRATQGHTLAQDIISHDTIPPFDNSAMDGYAVRVEDLAHLPVQLTVIEEIPAGAFPQQTVVSGTCARIMTGAPFPEGANAVVPVEWTEAVEDDVIQFNRAPAMGQHVRRAGRDVQAGSVVIAKGTVVTPPVIGMLATLGYPTVEVAVPPSVAVISTGDELVDAAEALGPGQIRNANGPALAAQVQSAGGQAQTFLARDNKPSIRATLEQALVADVLVFSGGVSVGQYDLVKQVLDEFGIDLLFWKVKQRPGKPLAFGLIGDKPVFGLPGNPVSSAMCFEQYVRPALAQMLGRSEMQRPRHQALLAADTPKVEGLHFFARGIASFNENGQLTVRDTGPQGSNLYSSVVRANCIFHIPASLASAPAGTLVEVEWLRW